MLLEKRDEGIHFGKDLTGVGLTAEHQLAKRSTRSFGASPHNHDIYLRLTRLEAHERWHGLIERGNLGLNRQPVVLWFA